MNPSAMELAVAEMLSHLGVDQTSEHFLRTPYRFATWLQTYKVPTHEEETTALSAMLSVQFTEAHDELVAVTNVSFRSLCAHHLLPFTGTASIAYIPNGKIVGVSKLVRALRYVAQRPTVQESITRQLADTLEYYLEPRGVMVVLKAHHQCMSLRGVEDPHVNMVTSAVRGYFLSNDAGCKDEFLSLCQLGG